MKKLMLWVLVLALVFVPVLLFAESGYGSFTLSPPVMVWNWPLPQLGHGGRCLVDPTCTWLPHSVHA